MSLKKREATYGASEAIPPTMRSATTMRRCAAPLMTLLRDLRENNRGTGTYRKPRRMIWPAGRNSRDFRRTRDRRPEQTRPEPRLARPCRCRLARRTRRSRREGAMSRWDSHHRRDFLARSLVVAGAAGLAASGLRADRAARPDVAAADPPLGALRRQLHHRAQAVQVAGRRHARGVVRAQCRGLAVQFGVRRRHHAQSDELRAGRLQLRLARIRHAGRPVATRRRVRCGRRQGDRRA